MAKSTTLIPWRNDEQSVNQNCLLYFVLCTKQLLLFSDVDHNSYDYHMARRKAVSNWLSKAADKKIEAEVKDANFKVNTCMLQMVPG